MSEKIIISSEKVPEQYQCDPMLNVSVEYNLIMLTKYEGNEKEIAQVYISPKTNQRRVGWLVPALSLLSIEHDYADNKYFKKHAYEIFQRIDGSVLYENTYILIVSERLWGEINGDLKKESLFVALAEFGLYPKNEDDLHALHKNTLAKPIESEITLDLSFNMISDDDNYISALLHHKLKRETNEYARFMYIYQFFELAMEFVFYREMNEYRQNKNHLGTIRDKFTKLSSESKLITLIYDKLELNQLDPVLNAKAKCVFGDYKDGEYYSNSHKAAVIYDIRNSLVHSYFRFNLQDELGYLCDYLEMELYKILKALFKDISLKDGFIKDYF